MPAYDVFISYRRDGGDDLSRLLYMSLKHDGYQVFYDVETMRSGKFNQQILDSIAASRSVIVVLPPRGLDRCADPEDWVRLELEYAIRSGKLLIPVMMRGFEWPERLPGSLDDLRFYQGIVADNSVFETWYGKLRSYINEAIGGTPAAAPQQAPQADSVTELGMMALEDREFQRADSLFDEALRQNAHNALAWLGKALVREKMSQESELPAAAHLLEENKDFLRALRFADPALKKRLEGHAAKVKRRLAPKKETPAKPAQPAQQETAKPAQPAQPARQETAKPAQPAVRQTAPAKPVKYDTLGFGYYPQTAGGKDHTIIEWLILEKRQGNMLLLSRFGLDARAFQPAAKELTEYERQLLGRFGLEGRAYQPAGKKLSEYERRLLGQFGLDKSAGKNDTWDTCALRAWLNGEFFRKAFDQLEQSIILTTDVDNSKSQGANTWHGGSEGVKDTKDRIFLLSCAEVRKYFGDNIGGNNKKRRASPTPYAAQAGAYVDTTSRTEDGAFAGAWTLRSPGANSGEVMCILSEGSQVSRKVTEASLMIRPALWIDPSKL